MHSTKRSAPSAAARPPRRVSNAHKKSDDFFVAPRTTNTNTTTTNTSTTTNTTSTNALKSVKKAPPRRVASRADKRSRDVAPKKPVDDDEIVSNDDDDDDDNDNNNGGVAVPAGAARVAAESADEKRARLARQYLSTIKQSLPKRRRRGDGVDDDGADDDDDDDGNAARVRRVGLLDDDDDDDDKRGRVVAGRRDDDIDEILARSKRTADADKVSAFEIDYAPDAGANERDNVNEDDDEDDDDDDDVRALVEQRLKADEKARRDLLVHAVAKKTRVLDGGRLWLKGLKSPITCVAVTNDAVFAGCKQGTIMQWCAKTGRRLHAHRGGLHAPVQGGGHAGAVLCLAVSNDGKLLVSGGADCLVRLWDVEARQLLDTFSGHREPVTGVAFRRNSHQFFSTSVDRTVRVWDGDERLYMDTLFGHQAAVQALAAFSKERCVTVGSDRTLRVWKILQESQLVFRGHKASIDCLAMLDEAWFVTGSQDGAVALWSATRKRPHAVVPSAHKTPLGNGGWVSACAALPLTDLVATGACDGSVRLWRADRKQGRLVPATFVFGAGAPGVRKAKLQKDAPEDADEHSGEAVAKAELETTLMPTTAYQAAMKASSIAADGFVNGLAFAPNGSFIVAALSREHRLGRWSTVRSAKDGLLLTRLQLPTTLFAARDPNDALFGGPDTDNADGFHGKAERDDDDDDDDNDNNDGGDK
jgi:ribosomal RNA-processing protein 9